MLTVFGLVISETTIAETAVQSANTGVSWPKLLLILAAAGIIIAGVLFYLKSRAGGTAPQREDAQARLSSDNRIAEGIRRHAKEFNGLYEGLYQANISASVFSADAYAEWCDRVSQTGDAAFTVAFEARFSKRDLEDRAFCRSQFGRLLRCIGDAGIVRGPENGTRIRIDETNREAYVGENGYSPKIGFEGTIIKSAWFYDKTVVESGLVTAVAKE